MNDPSLDALLERIPLYRDRHVVVEPLSGGLTNQNFRVDSEGESHVLRILSKGTDLLGIDREHEEASTRNAAALGVGPEVVYFSKADGVLVVRFIDGQTLSAESAREPERIRRIAKTIRRVHEGPAVPGRFCPFEIVREYHRLAMARGVTFPETFRNASETMDRMEMAVSGRRLRTTCHNDLLAANFVDDGSKIWVIDWEYGGVGDPFFDLGNFSVNQELDDHGDCLLLESYFGSVRTQDRAHLKLMRLASDLRESLWGYLQSGISELDEDYVGYGAKHLARFLEGAGSPDLNLWLTEVAG